mgnify:CR=1 FL=1
MFCISKEYWESWVWRRSGLRGGDSWVWRRSGRWVWEEVWEAVCSDSWVWKRSGRPYVAIPGFGGGLGGGSGRPYVAIPGLGGLGWVWAVGLGGRM